MKRAADFKSKLKLKSAVKKKVPEMDKVERPMPKVPKTYMTDPMYNKGKNYREPNRVDNLKNALDIGKLKSALRRDNSRVKEAELSGDKYDKARELESTIKDKKALEIKMRNEEEGIEVNPKVENLKRKLEKMKMKRGELSAG